jgi:single-stranded-DNA-specific exonuclease
VNKWIDIPHLNSDGLKSLDLHPLIAQTLLRRGISQPAQAQAFLDPDSYSQTSASQLPGIAQAIERIHLAIRKKELVCVWGDFDVDGQTATTVLVEALQWLGAQVIHHIPIRALESHGVHIRPLNEQIDRGAKLILTCDTGITAHDAVEHARSRGVDFVITDHHDPGETLPDATAIINPKLLPDGHPLSSLAGVGVAYKLVEALLDHGPTSMDHDLSPDSLLDLVALGLIADLALLRADARYLVQLGLEALRSTERLGLQTIYDLAGIQPATLNETTVGFALGPRLNALGRLDDANSAVELFTTRDPVRARVLAAQIEGLNAQRRLLTEQVTQAAEAQLRADPALLAQPVIVLGHAAWPGGVVGIVANRLVDRYQKPAILFNFSDDGLARGSARSIDGLHITESIATQKHMLHNFGGHPMAAGLALDQARLPEFRKALGSTVERKLAEAHIEEAVLEIDAWLKLDELSFELADAIERLAPFGPGNPALTLASRNVRVVKVAQLGKNKEHRRFTVEDEGGQKQDVLWWQSSGEELPEGRFDLAYTLRAGSFRGARQLNLEFVDFRVTEEKPVEVTKAVREIQDMRINVSTFERLNVETLVWAEGADKSKGKSRFALHPANEFAIWTTPPSSAELRSALELVKPQKIHVFAVPPAEEKPEAFLTRLAGLAKYATAHKSGKASVADLAAATAQRESAVRLGLEWLRAGGHISFLGEIDLTITSGTGDANQYAQKELYVAVKGLLDETAAYRKYFAAVTDLRILF